jgi:N6-adenosine-specific RNA methylase IME4
MKYRVILADPPWAYRNYREKCNGSPVPHYPPLKDSDIINLPVSNIAEKDSLLFLWGS